MTASITVLNPEHYHRIPDDIILVYGKIIGATGYAVYGYLCMRVNRRTGRCTPSIGRIADAYNLARSTVKEYLHKLRDVGLIAIEPRRAPAGDPTSNQYTLLDPSPAAVEQRRLARQAAAAWGRERSPAAPPPEEGVGRLPTGGRSPADPGGRSPADPEPESSLEPEEENQAVRSGAEEKPLKTTARPPCPHPLEERSYYGAITVCQHCWSLLDINLFPAAERSPEAPKEGTADATAA
jgi:hypothetical protein